MKNANDELKGFTGTEHYYGHTSNMIYTDGIKALCERFNCYWLIDIICSYQPQLRMEPFQAWSLGVNENHSAIVICTDGNDNILRTQDIPFTDFEAREATIWVECLTILLPSEH